MGIGVRKYIFTQRERAIVERFLSTGERSKGLKAIVYRTKNFDRLRADVPLYLALRRRLGEPEATTSA